MPAVLAAPASRDSDEEVLEKFAEAVLKMALLAVFSSAVLWSFYGAVRALLLWWAAATGRI